MKKKLITISLKLTLVVFTVLFIRVLQSKTIYDTLSEVYSSSPLLKSHRFKLEALNEELAKVLSNKRPKINM